MNANVNPKTIFTGDNLPIMRGMNSESVDLIYLDPPFNSNANYAAPIGSEAAGAAFKDTWTLSDVDITWLDLIEAKHPALNRVIHAAMTNSDKSYLIYMAVRLLEMPRILKDTGSIYLHCDPTMSHYLKLVMDAVFGKTNFRNEVVWKRTSTKSLAKRYAVNSDRILYYVKSNGATWNQQYAPYDDAYIQKTFRGRDKHGKYGTVDLSGGKAGSRRAYMPLKGIEPPPGRAWAPPTRNKFPASAQALLPDNYESLDQLTKCEVLDDAGLLHWPKGKIGRPRWKKYLSAMPGIVAGDLVLDTPPVKGKEGTGYPTQKPLALLDRIIEASSHEGDIVFDPFCGCATTLVAADRLQRDWIGIDISAKASELVVERISNDQGMFEDIVPRDDIPKRTDLGNIPRYNAPENRTQLYGEQAGNCNGCGEHFQKQHLEIDHIIARSVGGTDHIENLQLLCGHCNRIKGNRGQEYLISRLNAS